MILLSSSVGKGGKNCAKDVRIVQDLLNKSPVLGEKLAVDGKYGPKTYRAILQYQLSTSHDFRKCDGLISPTGRTLNSLCGTNTSILRTPSKLAIDSLISSSGGSECSPVLNLVSNSRGKISDSDCQSAAAALGPGVEPAIIKAFAEVESGGKSGFSASGNPKVAFEGHTFRKLTNRKFDQSYPQLSYPYVKKAGPEWLKNNKNDTTAWETLQKAAELDRSAAYQSASWGMFQVMGFNFSSCGYTNVEDFVSAMKAGERGQLQAFIGYCLKCAGLKKALADKNFVKCAILYNGSDYGDYDKRIAKAYRKYAN